MSPLSDLHARLAAEAAGPAVLPPTPAGRPAVPPAPSLPPEELPRVLLLDDEADVLESLSLYLRRHVRTVTATRGEDALRILAEEGPFAVVISDLRMPEMDGAQFLTQARDVAPDTVRVLLTGQADMDAAIAAVNEGRIFRFLTKPCPPWFLIPALNMALEQHRLLTAEKVLLKETLAGALRVLTQVMALVQPLAFGRASRARSRVLELCAEMKEDAWQVELAAMFSEIGCLFLPPEVAKAYYSGRQLGPDEQAHVNRLPALADDLLGNIPRLEEVRAILRGVRGESPDVPVGSRMLRLIGEFDALESRGLEKKEIIAALRSPVGRHDAAMVSALERLVVGNRLTTAVPQGALRRQVHLAELPIGAVLAADVTDTSGRLLIARGFEVTAVLREQIIGLTQYVDVAEPVWIAV